MRLVYRDSLLFTSVTVVHQGVCLDIAELLVDTGSATTLLAVDAVAPLGIQPEVTDHLFRIRGVGGVEYVFSRTIDAIMVSGHEITSIDVEFGALDYGFRMNGILGLDTLLRANAVIDLHCLTIECQE